MKLLLIYLVSLLVANPFVDRFMEGGPLFMSFILICLLTSLYFLVRGFLGVTTKPVQSRKMMSLASDAGLLGLVFGFLGSIIGLISAFDSIESFGTMNFGVMAAGLKVSFLTTVFGCFVFLVTRIGVLILKLKHKE